MSRRTVLVCLCLLASVACAPDRAADGARRTMDETEDPAELVVRNEQLARERFGHHMRALLLGGQYDSLELIAADLRSPEARWPAGTFKLRSFYSYGFAETDQKESETQWRALVAASRAWVQRTGTVTARVALAHALYGYGWHARGEGYASEVTEDGQRLFDQRLDEAASVIADAARQQERCPGLALVLLWVAQGRGWDRAVSDSIFTAAVREYPWYLPYYLQRAVYLLPRWYGRTGEWESYASAAADRVGGQEGDALYARIVMSQSDYYRNVFDETSASWSRTAKGFEYLIRRYPGSLELKSQYAFLAVVAEDRARARGIFPLLGSRIDPEVWSTRERFIASRNWAVGS